MTNWSSFNLFNSVKIESAKYASISALFSAFMLTSGSIIGTKPAAIICLATSNCCLTTKSMPSLFNSRMLERILVPKILCSFARLNKLSNSGIGFIN